MSLPSATQQINMAFALHLNRSWSSSALAVCAWSVSFCRYWGWALLEPRQAVPYVSLSQGLLGVHRSMLVSLLFTPAVARPVVSSEKPVFWFRALWLQCVALTLDLRKSHRPSQRLGHSPLERLRSSLRERAATIGTPTYSSARANANLPLEMHPQLLL